MDLRHDGGRTARPGRVYRNHVEVRRAHDRHRDHASRARIHGVDVAIGLDVDPHRRRRVAAEKPARLGELQILRGGRRNSKNIKPTFNFVFICLCRLTSFRFYLFKWCRGNHYTNCRTWSTARYSRPSWRRISVDGSSSPPIRSRTGTARRNCQSLCNPCK